MAVSVAAALLKPAVTTLAFESAQKYLHAYVERKGRGDDTRHDQLRQGLSSLLQLAEQDVLRDLNSGLAALEDSIESQNEGTRQSRLQFAEQQLLRCTHLDPSLSTGGQPNTYLMAVAHHKLALAGTLRGDRVIAAKHILKCFIADPRAARLELAPDLYQQLFEPRCTDILEWRDQEYNKIAGKYASKWLNFQSHVLKGASGAVSAWGKGVDWLLTKAQRDPRKKGSKASSPTAPIDFLDSSSGDDAGPSSATRPERTGGLNEPSWGDRGHRTHQPAMVTPIPYPNGGEGSAMQSGTAGRKPEVEYARAVTSRWSSQMDAQAREAEEQAVASGRVVKRVNEKKRAVDKAVEQKLDERCRQVADELLRGGSPGEINLRGAGRGGQAMQATIADASGGQAQVTFLSDSVQVHHLTAPS
ncbi:Hypothetical [Klebsormidium nitens]|uniref:Putative E3 ubiquitin-protein ligase LIN N-terminal domain-containing protein n=1 Tax=Klebsormidium nitens TaxID=105231 RepID=A0A1Y1I423_KLENI|nr:Hypothetical [Klebsormidium nitens]|eukprot:GAQ84179.1 Hypothetical [Klebsormidium nitens]